MRYSELTRKLKKLGVEYLRQAGGSHEIWWKPNTALRTTIPNHPSKGIPTGTLRTILKDLDLRLDDLKGK